MNRILIAPLAAMLMGLGACTFEESPYTGYQATFAVGAPLYYAGGPVTWHYYDGYTYHLIDHHGRFVGYAYYDYDDFYRIANIHGDIVYYLRWSNRGWRIDDYRGRHVGFINADDHGGYWLADRQGHRHGALLGWGRSRSHGHAHAGHHDDRVERHEARERDRAEHGRWRDKRRDAEIRHRQQEQITNTHDRARRGNEDRSGIERQLKLDEDGFSGAERRHRGRDDDDNDHRRNRGRKHGDGVRVAPGPAPAARTPAATPKSVVRPAPTAPRTRQGVRPVRPAQKAQPKPGHAVKTRPVRAAPQKQRQAAPKDSAKPAEKPEDKELREKREEIREEMNSERNRR